MRKYLAILILFFQTTAYATTTTGTTSNEVIPDFTDQSVPVLNQTIQKLQTDIKTVQSEITTFTPTASNALSGSIIQEVDNVSDSTFGTSANKVFGAVDTGTGTMSPSDAIPTKTDGDQYQQISITPHSASNRLEIDSVTVLSNSARGDMVVALFQGSTTNALTATYIGHSSSGNVDAIPLPYSMTAGTTSTITFKIRAGTSSGTNTFNGISGGRLLGGVMSSSMKVRERKV